MGVLGYFLKDVHGTHLDRGLIIDRESGYKIGFCCPGWGSDKGKVTYLRFNQDDGHPVDEEFYKNSNAKRIKLEISSQDFSRLARILEKALTNLDRVSRSWPKIGDRKIEDMPEEEMEKRRRKYNAAMKLCKRVDRFLEEYCPDLIA